VGCHWAPEPRPSPACCPDTPLAVVAPGDVAPNGVVPAVVPEKPAVVLLDPVGMFVASPFAAELSVACACCTVVSVEVGTDRAEAFFVFEAASCWPRGKGKCDPVDDPEDVAPSGGDTSGSGLLVGLVAPGLVPVCSNVYCDA